VTLATRGGREGSPPRSAREDIHAAYFGAPHDLVDTIVQGVLLGGLYALFAAGLSLVFGIMRLVNLAHGDLIVLGAYLILVIGLGARAEPLPRGARRGAGDVPPWLGAAAVVLNRTLGDDILPPLLVTFGLSIVLQNGCSRSSRPTASASRWGALETASVALGPLSRSA
jgi:branched-chain amino acid transport system permease protein